eukprot:37566_1
MSHCDVDEPFNGILLEFAFMLPIVIVLQLLLFGQTVWKEYKRSNLISIQLRIFYIVIQVLGLLWSITDLFRFVIDPFAPMFRNGSACNAIAYLTAIVPILYYSLYLYQIYVRTESSFSDSIYALKTHTKYLLLLFLVLIPSIAAPVSFFITNKENTSCILPWKPIDFPSLYNHGSFAFCSLSIAPTAYIIITLFTVWTGIANIIIGIIFCYQLHQLLATDVAIHNSAAEFQFKSVMIKCCILTITGSISIILSYALWSGLSSSGSGFGIIFLHVDSLVNCLVIGLMFRHNERYYNKLCHCCHYIVLCSIQHVEKDKAKKKISTEDELDGDKSTEDAPEEPKEKPHLEPRVVSIELDLKHSIELKLMSRMSSSDMQTVTSLIAHYGSTNLVDVMEAVEDDEDECSSMDPFIFSPVAIKSLNYSLMRNSSSHAQSNFRL